MKVLLVDPTNQTVSAKNVEPHLAELRRLIGAKFTHVARLPNGDSVGAVPGSAGPNTFSIGGGLPIAGKAIVLRRTRGEYRSARSDAETILGLVRWSVQVEPDTTPTETGKPDPRAATAKAIIVDPASGMIEEVIVKASKAGLDEVAGGETSLIMKVTTNDAVLVLQSRGARPWRWRKDELVFPGRSVIVGWDKDGNIGNATTTLEDLMGSVEFKAPGKNSWSSYSR